MLQGDGKMSKSKGNVLYADELVDMFGVDAVRYFVLHEMPFDNDGVISWELLVERINSDLANTLGNLVNRTISMSNKYFGGAVNSRGETDPVDEQLKAVVCGTRDKVAAKMADLRVADAISEIFALFKRCNKYIDETMPWALAKDENQKARLETVLYNLVESITIGANLLSSFMPGTAEKILEMLNAGKRDFDDLASFGFRENGIAVTDAPEILFERLKLEDVMKKVEELHPSVPEEPAAEETVHPQETAEDILMRAEAADEEEDLEKGEVNPYTGHEYESNTVRMHPKRIGYVQVYDRSSHQWTDMTEWAFLGYQERKKALLGNDYEPPIYLD